MKSFLLTSLLVFVACGCERTRSFMQMDSNSGSPFLGLQLSVDAKAPADKEVTIANVADSEEADVKGGIVTTVSSSSRYADLVPTARSKTSTGNLKYSLPKLDLTTDPKTAAEVDDILTRI